MSAGLCNGRHGKRLGESKDECDVEADTTASHRWRVYEAQDRERDGWSI